ncbi:hypothetical protein PoB_001729500 [Plakobranchus ocellatus]|uniref:Ammonium transporter AmtB-like domain-containing protein n=1 Tax=Plakobranchus ocellatus TaxID=259542 RepID=A0AAV3Z894_9GAST|nr:hypothetical protein PoB_001729500 [Plakobranchus ocellatus]
MAEDLGVCLAYGCSQTAAGSWADAGRWNLVDGISWSACHDANAGLLIWLGLGWLEYMIHINVYNIFALTRPIILTKQNMSVESTILPPEDVSTSLGLGGAITLHGLYGGMTGALAAPSLQRQSGYMFPRKTSGLKACRADPY